MTRIGVLALQGSFAEHIDTLRGLGVEGFEIRQRPDIAQPFDGLIIPGGESTVIDKLLRDLGLFDPLLAMLRDGLPVFGTCAGLLLLAKTVENNGAPGTREAPGFATMDIAARRNAYGRQLGSFFARSDFAGTPDVPMTFIRAPYIESAGTGVSVLATVGGHVVAARQGSQLVAAFHPELGGSTVVHEYFLREVVG